MSGWENLAPPSKRAWNLTRLKLAARFIQVSNYDSQNIKTSVEIRNSEAHREDSGHSINKYQIHGEKSMMAVKNEDQTKMEEGKYFAIETFGSTGRRRVVESVRMSKLST